MTTTDNVLDSYLCELQPSSAKIKLAIYRCIIIYQIPKRAPMLVITARRLTHAEDSDICWIGLYDTLITRAKTYKPRIIRIIHVAYMYKRV